MLGLQRLGPTLLSAGKLSERQPTNTKSTRSAGAVRPRSSTWTGGGIVRDGRDGMLR